MKATRKAVILKPFSMEKQTKSGLVIQQERRRHDANVSVGEVVDVGPMAFAEEMWMERDLNINVSHAKPGDKVLTAKHAGHDVKFGEEVYRLVLPDDLLAIVTTEEVEALTTWK